MEYNAANGSKYPVQVGVEMKPHEVAELLGISVSAVRTWSLDEFRDYLSPTAQGGTNRRRDFTDQDVLIIAQIAAMTRRSLPREEIHAELRRLQANDWRELPPLSQQELNTASGLIVPSVSAQAALDVERRFLLREIASWQQRAEQLEKSMADERAKAGEKQEELLRELAELSSKLSEAQLLVKLYEEGRIKPRSE